MVSAAADDAAFALRSPPPLDAFGSATPLSFRTLSRSTSYLGPSLDETSPFPGTRPPTPDTPPAPDAAWGGCVLRSRTARLCAAPPPPAARQATPTSEPSHPSLHPPSHPPSQQQPPPHSPQQRRALLASTPLLWVLRISPPPLPLTPDPPGGIPASAAGAAGTRQRDDTGGGPGGLGEIVLPCEPAGEDGAWRMVPPPPRAADTPRSPTGSPGLRPPPLTPLQYGAARGEAEAEAMEWVSTLRWVPFELCLRHGLLQVIQCFADRRFELRRMADQVRLNLFFCSSVDPPFLFLPASSAL